MKLSPFLRDGWSVNAPRVLSCFHAGHAGFGLEHRVDPRRFVGEARGNGIHSPQHDGSAIQALSQRLLQADGLAQKSANGTKRVSGSLVDYVRFSSLQNRALGTSLLVNLLAGETVSGLGFADAQDVHIGGAVGPGRQIVVIRPAQRASTLPAAVFAEWEEYLARGATKTTTLELPCGLVKQDRHASRYARLQQRYRDYDRYHWEAIEKYARRAKTLVPLIAEADSLTDRLRSLVATLVRRVPSSFPSEREKALKKAARAACQTPWFEEETDGGSTHDRTGTYRADRRRSDQEKIAQTLSDWQQQGVPAEILARVELEVIANVTGPLTPKVPLPLLFGALRRSAAYTALVKTHAQQPNALDEGMGTPEGLQQRLQEAIASCAAQIQSVCEVLARFGRLEDSLTRRAFAARSEAVLKRAEARLSRQSLFVDVWSVNERFTVPGAEAPRPFSAPDKSAKGNSASSPTPSGKASLPSPGAVQVVTQDIFSEAFVRVRSGSPKWEVLEAKGILDMENIPRITPELFNRGVITVDDKLRASATGAADVYLLADNIQRVYNPALGRMSGLRQALLTKPTMVAQGADYVERELQKFGYEVSIPPGVVNRIARAAERSRRNAIPLRPVEPFEATAFYDYGKHRAEMTVVSPDGTPIWIAGKEYTIVPGWRRIQITLSEDERDNGLGGLRLEREVIDVAVTHWTVETEGDPVEIGENEIREEAEIRTSTALYPAYAAEAMAASARNNPGRSRRAPGAADGVGAVTTGRPLSDEEYAILHQVQTATSVEAAASQHALEHPTQDAPANPQAPKWPAWKPYLDEFVEVFPPRVPESASVVSRKEVTALMQKIALRFGPKYQRAVNDTLPPIPPRVEEQAFSLWLRDRRAAQRRTLRSR